MRASFLLAVAASLGSSSIGAATEPTSRSRRAQFTTGVGVKVEVQDTGAATLTIESSTAGAAATVFEVASAFSQGGFTEAGTYNPPTWHGLGNLSGMPTLADSGLLVKEASSAEQPATLGQMVVKVDRSAAASKGTWVVTAKTGLFALRRVFQLVPAPPLLPRKVLVNDSLTSLTAQLIGTHVRHHARLIEGGEPAGAAVPGRFLPNSCGTENNAGIFGTVYHPTNFGRPDVWMNTTAGTGVALVALDDAFRVHGECWQSAVPSLNPRVTMSCPVSSPPSIRLADPRLALSPGETHTIEWAIFPQGGDCSSYWCFINAMRYDFGTDKLPVGVNAGPESAMGNAPTFMVIDTPPCKIHTVCA